MDRGIGRGMSSFISIIIFYLVFIALFIFFVYQVLNKQAVDNTLYLTIFWIASSVVTGILFIGIIINIVKLIQERNSRIPGAVLKTRLVLFFVILTLLSTLPQGLLSMSFIRLLGDTWFNDTIGEGIQTSLDVTVDMQKSFSDDLENFVYSVVFEILSEQAQENPDRFFVQIRQIRPSITAVQLFSPDGEIFYFGGDESARIREDNFRKTQEGLVMRDIRPEGSFIRTQRFIHNIVIVLMEKLPDSFAQSSLQVLEASKIFYEYRRIKDMLFTSILIFYGIFSLPLLFLALHIGFYLSTLHIQPIVYLEQAIHKVADGDFSFRILSRSREGFDPLVKSFNFMVAELDRSRYKLLQTERIAAWKDIAQRLAHEIKNPLTPIRLSVERLELKYHLKADNFSDILETSVQTIVREVDHLSQLITEFRDFARLPFPKLEKVCLYKLIMDSWEMHKRVNVTLNVEDINKNIIIYVDPAQFRQVLGNLLRNANEAIGENEGNIQFNHQILETRGKKFHRIQIKDTGKGIDDKSLAHIFDPYFTNKIDGTGLGLAIVKRIIQDHNGEVLVESKKGYGTSFFIDIPIQE